MMYCEFTSVFYFKKLNLAETNNNLHLALWKKYIYSLNLHPVYTFNELQFDIPCTIESNEKDPPKENDLTWPYLVKGISPQ